MCLFRPGGAGFARWCYWRKVAAAAKIAGTGRARCSGTSSVSPSEDSRCKSVATSLFPLASGAFSPLRKMWSSVMNIT